MAKIFQFLKRDCKIEQTITLKTYLFGFNNALGLNHILLELKKEIFYNWKANIGVVTFCEYCMVKVRKIMIKEKEIMIANEHYQNFVEKWKSFTSIYDFNGPDQQIVY